jgi:hypothetical protein
VLHDTYTDAMTCKSSLAIGSESSAPSSSTRGGFGFFRCLDSGTGEAEVLAGDLAQRTPRSPNELRSERTPTKQWEQSVREEKNMQQDQNVQEMAEEVLERQAKALAQRSGDSLEDARQAVADSEAGRQLRELAQGEHRYEKTKEWQGSVFWGRAEERLMHHIGSEALALCSRTPLLVARELHGVVGRQGGARPLSRAP